MPSWLYRMLQRRAEACRHPARRFRGQLVKLLAALQRDFLPALRSSAGDDIGALATLLDSYVADGLYRKPPEGRNMPTFDISSMDGNRA